MLRIKRAYDPASEEDGQRILVDRVWPRGVSKERASLDRWAKELAPSTELRKWFSHDEKKWDEFTQRYTDELARQEAGLKEIAKSARNGAVTLVYGSRDEEHNQAVVLKAVLDRLMD
jgi:uncharacterized protein YeaO (DUF488 family)